MTKAITKSTFQSEHTVGRRSDRAARSGHSLVPRCFRSPKNPPTSRKRSIRRTIGSRRASRRPSRNLANDPRWITTDEVVAINARQVASSNEPHFLLRRDSLVSGRAPAAALRLFGRIDRRSGPRDRTASRDRAEPSFSARQLNRNGYDLDAPDEGVPVATAIIDVLEKRSGPDRFRDFIAPFVSPFDAL